MLRPRAAAAAIFLVSATALSMEIALTRLFSLLFQYHFAFLAISIAVFGLSIGAALASLLRAPPGHSSRLIAQLLQGLSLSLALFISGAAFISDTTTVTLHAALALIPFIFTGLILAVTFREYAIHSGALYAADLAGAALGVVAVLLLLTIASPYSIALFLSLLAALASLALLRLNNAAQRPRRALLGGAVALLVAAMLLVLNLSTAVVDYQPQRIERAPRDKTMLAILRDPGQDARIVASRWSPFARVDVVESNDPTALYVFTDAGAGSLMLRDNSDGDAAPQQAALQRSIEYLPFTTGPPGQNVLVLGAGGGRDVALALAADAAAITAVEVNPAVVELTRRFADYNGAILDRDPVQLVVGDARNFVERATQQYDLIYLNLVYTQSFEPASQALVENYIYTVEAFESYFQHLAPGGRLALVTHNALEGSRAAVTALQALEKLGLPAAQGMDHLMVWMLPHDDPTLRSTVMLLSESAFTAEAVARFTAEAGARGMQALYVPGDFELFFAPLRRGGPVSDFIDADADFDLSPTVDDSPYFFHLNFGLPPPVRSALIWALALSALLALIALASSPRRRSSLPAARRTWLVLLLYAALIGAGFMLVEIPLIQRFQLLFGYPILSLAMVLAVLLLAGGLGSFLSQRWPVDALPRLVAITAVAIGALIILYWLLLPSLIDLLLPAPLAVRLLAAAALTALLGLPLGVPFPSLLRLARRHASQSAPPLWALNGAFSVLGSTLAVVISMRWGFSWALLAGAALYLLLSLLALGPIRAWMPEAA